MASSNIIEFPIVTLSSIPSTFAPALQHIKDDVSEVPISSTAIKKESSTDNSDPLDVSNFLLSPIKEDIPVITTSMLDASTQQFSITELVSVVMEKLQSRKVSSNNSRPAKRRDICTNSFSTDENIKYIQRRRERHAMETAEETTLRLLRQRMITMKNRLVLRLEMPEKYEERQNRATSMQRLKSKKRRAVETLEDEIARKKRQAAQVHNWRLRTRAIETPEQVSERNAKQSSKRAKETIESTKERILRLQRKRSHQRKQRERKRVGVGVEKKISAKTGKLYGRKGSHNGVHSSIA